MSYSLPFSKSSSTTVIYLLTVTTAGMDEGRAHFEVNEELIEREGNVLDDCLGNVLDDCLVNVSPLYELITLNLFMILNDQRFSIFVCGVSSKIATVKMKISKGLNS